MAVLKTVGVITAAFLLIMLMSYWAAGRARPVLDAAIRADLTKRGIAHAFIELSDGMVHYRLEGPAGGPLIVLIHGFSTPSFVWDDYFAPLTGAGYRVLSFDNYGRGFSDRPKTRYDANLSDREMVELLDKLAPGEAAHVVGYSMGGATATLFAARHPERVRSLTLIAPAGLDVATSDNIELLKRRMIGDWIVRMFGLKIFHAGAADQSKFAPNPARFLTDFDRQMDYRGYGDALLSTLRHYPLAGADAAYAEAGRSSRPVMVIWGEADDTVPFVNARKLMALMPRAKLYSYPRLGHEIGFSQSQMLAGLISQFVNSQDAASPGAPSPAMRLEARPDAAPIKEDVR
ncbi:MAG TPA: alpha/beta fold hydrolase [Parvibaculum sp.]|jgi:pimeloyl-ACP methyl ester carboxylesterase